MGTSGSDMEKLMYSWGKIGVGVKHRKSRCSRELGDRFGAKKVEAQVE